MNARNGIKICSRCRKPKPVDEFRVQGCGKHDRHIRCAACRLILALERCVDEARAA